MSYFIGDDGKEYDLFGKGGAAIMAEDMHAPLLGTIPINTALRKNADNGNPTANFETDDSLGDQLLSFCRNLAGQVSIKALGGASQPTLTIS